MQLRILGPVGVETDDGPVSLGGPRQRALLAYLLLHANESVPAERLLDRLWEEPPGGGVAALQSQVSRLRRLLGDRIVSSSSGYAIRVAPGELDLERFRVLLAEAGAEAEPGERSRLLREADGLWHGEPLSGLDGPFVRAEAAALEELRLAALEDRVEADLACGLAAELVSELSALVARHPLRERLRGQLILALYRSGRQADALEAYRETRRMLDEQLGLEPGPALRELEKAILRHDHALDLPAAAHSREPATSMKRHPGPRVVLVALALAIVAAGSAATLLILRNEDAGTRRAHNTQPGTAAVAHTVRKNGRITISDGFGSDYLDPTIWHTVTDGGDVSIAEQGGQLVLAVGPKAVPGGTYDQIDVHAGTQCSFPGDFDARVDYTLLEWPAGDNVWVGLNAIYASGAVLREASSQFGDDYRSWVTTASGNVPLPDSSGSLRITRVDGVESTYFWHEGGWRKLASAVSPGAAVFGLGASSGANDSFGHKEVKVAFDNFRVTAKNPICPP